MGQCCSSKRQQVSQMAGNEVRDLSMKTGLNIDELKSYYGEFIKDYPCGHVNKKQFRKIYRNFSSDDAKEREKVEQVFKTFDQNNDGTIDFREFMIALSCLSKGTLEQKLSLAFYLYDENGDGVLSFEEVLDIVKAMYSMAKDQSATANLPPAEVFAKGLFAELDKDKDGIVTLEEFMEVGCHDVIVANLLLANVAVDGIEEDYFE
ncbi:neurocalcin homolog [Ciona intestinalis]